MAQNDEGVFCVGQWVWIPRTGGSYQRSQITQIVPDMRQVSVEWCDETGVAFGKRVTFDCVQCGPLQDEVPLDPGGGGCRVGGGREVCSSCGQSFKNARGLNTHMFKKHPIEANRIKLNSILKSAAPKNHRPEEEESSNKVRNEIDKWAAKFKELAKMQSTKDVTLRELDTAVREFLNFLREIKNELPGPKHPAIRYYKMRKRGDWLNKKGSGRVTNPQRTNKTQREKRKFQYQYDLAQYNYYNQRKKVVHQIMNYGAPNMCQIQVSEIESHFKSILETTNGMEKSVYNELKPNPKLSSVRLDAMHRAIKTTKLDTSPGPDGVLIKTIKALNVGHILKQVADIMLMTGYVPEPLRQGRTILIYKGKGDVRNVNSWRPITIYSIVRRLIEKVFDYELKEQVNFHPGQRGFVNGMPGCHVNTRILDGVLRDAKLKRKDCAVVFLDITAAFDNVGHAHIMKTLQSKGVSEDLSDIIGALLGNNSVTVSTGIHRTGSIAVRRGVPQGGPLSGTLFNLAVDHLYDNICDPIVARQYGYELSPEGDGNILMGFADDICITANSLHSAIRITDAVMRKLKEIGLQINVAKSTAIVLERGELINTQLKIGSEDVIQSVNATETVKYLGCSFSGELVVNDNSIEKFNQNLSKLVTSNLLKPEQKLNIVNQYIFPSLTYPLQTAPLLKLQPQLLDGIDTIIRRSVKAMLGLPANASTAMMYAPRRYRGLGIMRCEWEAPLQHLSMAQRLAKVNDILFQRIFDFEAEVKECARRLNMNIDQQEGLSVRRIRQSLRENSFEEWSSCRWQGIGVGHYKESTQVNKFMWDRALLTGSEWTNAVKLNINYAPLRGVPGASGQGDVGPLCRRCGRETETPAHVVGSCPYNMLLITRRHHNVKQRIIDLLKDRDFTCHEEVHCVDSDGTVRFADIIAFPKDSGRAVVLDPTVWYESNCSNQAAEVDIEKKAIYNKCIPFLKEKFYEKYGSREYSVHGLWFGARGTIPEFTRALLESLNLDLSGLPALAESIILDSIGIIQHHIYG